MQECRMAKVENIVVEKLIITRAVNMTLHVGPARVVHEVEVWKLCGIGGLLPHPHPDESEFFEDRIGPGDRGLRDDPVAVRVEDTLTIRIETQRSEEHTSELQSLMRISYAVFCLKKQKNKPTTKSL